MGPCGMARSFRIALEAGGGAQMSPEELLSAPVEAEREDRGVEDIDFALKRNLTKTAFLDGPSPNRAQLPSP
jgi:hypothetical protein